MARASSAEMSENDRVAKAAGIVGAATLLSRIFGFIRDVVIAWYFGAGLASDAFFVAFRIPNLLRRLFAEGSLSISFVPVYTEYLATRSREDADHLARSAFKMLALILLLVAAAGMVLSPLIVRVIAPGFADTPEKLDLTISLTRMMFPYIFFIGLVALSMGVLNSLGHFAAPALAPLMLNIAIIGAVYVIAPRSANPVTGLAIGVIIGGFLQLALQLPFLVKYGVRFWQKAPLFHHGLKRIGKLMLPAVFGAAVYQVNILVGTLLASLLPEGSVSYLYYADRLVQFPLGIFAIAIATAVLPSLSRQVAGREIDAARATFAYALKLVFFITIPAMIGLIVLRAPIVGLLFKRGAFDAETTRLTAYALLFYAFGLWAFSAVRIVVAVFYALQDTRTPVKIATVSILVNILLGVLLMQWLSHGGLALATSLSSMLNFGLLMRALRKRIGHLNWSSIFTSLIKTVVCSLLMGVMIWMSSAYLIPADSHSVFSAFKGVFACILIGIGSYGILAFALKCEELNSLCALVRRETR